LEQQEPDEVFAFLRFQNVGEQSHQLIDYLSASTAFLGSIVVGNGVNSSVMWLGRYFEERREGKTVADAVVGAHLGTWSGTLAAALGADCEIYSDVDGVFSADPRVVPSAMKLEALSFEEMQELAAAGAKVLNAQAVEFAREKGITIHALSTHTAGSGTAISAGTSTGRVKGVTCDTDVWVFATNEAPAALLELLDANQVKGRNLVCDLSGRALAVVPLQDVHGPEVLRAKLPTGVQVLDGLATVTCVGTGLNADWSVARKAMSAAAAVGATLTASYASSLQLTLVVDRDHAKLLTKALHEALIG
jgi:aspartate kinase